MKLKSLIRYEFYYLKTEKGKGISYINGNLFYTKMNTRGNIDSVTKFETEHDARIFAVERTIYYDSIGKVKAKYKVL